MAMLTVGRLQRLVQALAEMMKEGDGEASIAFALKVDDQLEKLRPKLEASNKTRQRIGLKHCDRDRQKNPILGAQESLKFSSEAQREALELEVSELNESEFDVPIEAVFTHDELRRNGIATPLGRLIALAPVLSQDTARDSA